MTDGNGTLLGSYMKKRGIDLSSLASWLWEFMLATVSTTPLLPVQNILVLVTTAFLLKLHELWSASKFFEVLYHTIVTELGVGPFFLSCTVHTL